MNKPTLLLDFDGVIHSYTSGWKGARNIPDPPVAGALSFIVKAMNYFEVCIYSSRSRQWGGKRAMKKWLRKHYLDLAHGQNSGMDEFTPGWLHNLIFPEGPHVDPSCFIYGNRTGFLEKRIRRAVNEIIKNIKFPTKKPAAFLTIDDRALQFEGSFWNPEELTKFKPWYKERT